jgi:hypothetical protein
VKINNTCRNLSWCVGFVGGSVHSIVGQVCRECACDIKPDNFLMELGRRANKVLMVLLLL